MRIAIIITAAFISLAVLLSVVGAGLQRSATRRAVDRLQGQARSPGRTVEHDQLAQADLPAVVRRYLLRALPDGTPVPATVWLRQEGFFRMAPEKEPSRLRAEQWFTLDQPGYVWEGTITPLPLLPFYALDDLVGETGSFSGRLLGLAEVVGESGEVVVVAAMLRLLAEAAWFPQMLLPSQYVRWEAVDETHARVVLTIGSHRVSGIYAFDEQARPTSFSASRPRTVDGAVVWSPWGGEYSAYRRMDGVEIPTRSRGIWHLPEGDFVYFDATIAAIRFADRLE